MNYFELNFVEKQLERLRKLEKDKIRDNDEFGNFMEDRKLSMYDAAKAFIAAFEKESEINKDLIDVEEALECVSDALVRYGPTSIEKEIKKEEENARMHTI